MTKSRPKRADYSRLQELYSSMKRSERLAACLSLVNAVFQEVDGPVDLVTAKLTLTGGKAFSEAISEIEDLSNQLPAKMLVESAIDILEAELRVMNFTIQ